MHGTVSVLLMLTRVYCEGEGEGEGEVQHDSVLSPLVFIIVLEAWPRGYKSEAQSQTQNKAQ